MRLVTRYLGGMSPLAKPLGAHGDVLRAAFTLMATAALSSECRAVMRKVSGGGRGGHVHVHHDAFACG